MKTMNILLVSALLASACGDDSSAAKDARPTPEADVPKTYKQIEQLGRPGIAEVLLISNEYLSAYNAFAPTFTGVPQASVDAVVGEARVVLQALYLGACYINGKLNLLPAAGVKPANDTCAVVGDAVFQGAAIAPAALTGSVAYANKVLGQFLPDVMRVDLGVASTYQNLCAAGAAGSPLLCGGRLLNEDVIDVTYDYLLNGANGGVGTPKDLAIVSRLVSDGVQFSRLESQNSLNRTTTDLDNRAQGHTGNLGTEFPNISNTVFPYSAPAY